LNRSSPVEPQYKDENYRNSFADIFCIIRPSK